MSNEDSLALHVSSLYAAFGHETRSQRYFKRDIFAHLSACHRQQSLPFAKMEEDNRVEPESSPVPSDSKSVPRWPFRTQRQGNSSVKSITSAPTDSQVDEDLSERTQSHRTSILSQFCTKNERKLVGLKNHALNRSATDVGMSSPAPTKSVEQMEREAREHTATNPFKLLLLGLLAASKVMAYYLITLETVLGILITTGLTCYWYFAFETSETWSARSLDFILLAFAVTSPIAAALGMAFTRRERALIAIADFRASAYHIYAAHSFWDYTSKGEGGRVDATIDWPEHCDMVLAQLIGLGDELARFLSLPTSSRSRHRMTRSGRKEAVRTMEAAYHLMESMTTQRLTRLILYSERLKKQGLGSSESSRLRQYERYLSSNIEQLRMVKMYRTPQALRSFARIFTLVLPAFYAPTYAQVARDVESLGMGITFGIITVLCLTALFESLQILEDPFTAYLALDGIDVHEEFEVLLFAQLMNTRMLAFPEAAPYPAGRRAALMNNQSASQLQLLGQMPKHSSLDKDEEDSEATPLVDRADVELGAVLQDDTLNGVGAPELNDCLIGGAGESGRPGLSRRLSGIQSRSVSNLQAGFSRRTLLSAHEQSVGLSLRNVQAGEMDTVHPRRAPMMNYIGASRRTVWE